MVRSVGYILRKRIAKCSPKETGVLQRQKWDKEIKAQVVVLGAGHGLFSGISIVRTGLETVLVERYSTLEFGVCFKRGYYR